MNRRDFIKALVGVPLLGLLKPEEVEIADDFKQCQPELIETIKEIDSDGRIFFDIAAIDQELSFGPDDAIYVGGAFVIPEIITNDEYWARWNGQEFEKIDNANRQPL